MIVSTSEPPAGRLSNSTGELRDLVVGHRRYARFHVRWTYPMRLERRLDIAAFEDRQNARALGVRGVGRQHSCVNRQPRTRRDTR